MDSRVLYQDTVHYDIYMLTLEGEIVCHEVSLEDIKHLTSAIRYYTESGQKVIEIQEVKTTFTESEIELEALNQKLRQVGVEVELISIDEGELEFIEENCPCCEHY